MEMSIKPFFNGGEAVILKIAIFSPLDCAGISMLGEVRQRQFRCDLNSNFN
jgi:hypothetical protein